VDVVFPATLVEKIVFSPSCALVSFVENQLTVPMWVNVWIFYFNLLVFMSVFVPIPCCCDHYGSVVQFEVGNCDTSCIGHFAENCLTILCFHMTFSIDFSSSVKNVIGILIATALSM
jgi:hypothetical protein